MRILSASAVFLVIIAGYVLPAKNTAHASEVRDFDNYLELLLEKDPDLKSLEYALEAKRLVPDQVESLPDPMVRFGLMNVPYDSFSMGQEGMTQKKISLMQSFPAPGKRSMLRKLAEDDIEIASTMVPEKRLELAQRARTAFYRLRYLKNVRRIVLRDKKILDGFIKVALAKYSVGKGLQQNVLHAQVELTKMTDRLRRIEEKIAGIGNKLAVWVDLPLDTDWSGIEIGPLPDLGEDADFLLEEALAKRPMFKKMRTEIRKAENKVGLARLGLRPDYTVAFSYGQRDDGPMGPRDDFLSSSVTLKIPWWKNTKQEKKIAENMILRRKAEQRLRSATFKTREIIANLIETIRKDHDLLELYDTGLIPQASQSVEAAVAAYQVNKVDFLTLVTNQITLFNYEVKRDEIQFELNSGHTALWRMLGRDGTEDAQ
ncbi:MAG: TolC family protein [Nitrospinota bacterium]